jgi:hypothetical protein
VDLSSNQTVAGNKEFTGTTTAHDLVPSATDTYNFGSSTAQWNNAYIKSLTINGVACGDILTHNASEFVNVSSNQTIGGEKNFTSLQKMKSLIINPTASIYKVMYGSTEGVMGPYGGGTVPNSNINPYRFYVGKERNYANAPIIIDTNMMTSGSTNIILRSASNESEDALDHRFYIGTSVIDNGDGTKTKNAYVQFYNTNEIKPNKNGRCNLGTASNKWADVGTNAINSLNPGALSLPNLNTAIDISGSLDTSQSSENTYIPPSDGYISILGRSASTSGIVIKTNSLFASMGQSVLDFGTNDRVSFCMCPVFKDQTVTIWLKSVTSLDSAKFFPCQGNV